MSRVMLNDSVEAVAEVEEGPDAVQFRQAVDGVVWPFRLTIRLPEPRPANGERERGEFFAVLSEVAGELRMVPPRGPWLAVASAVSTGVCALRSGGDFAPLELRAYVSSAALARIEVLRDGHPPRFELWVTGRMNRVGRFVRNHADNVPYFLSGTLPLSFARETWTSALRSAGIAQNVVLEVPLDARVSTKFRRVRKALLEAGSEFERGGALGWRGCAGAVRLAMDSWPGRSKHPIVQLDKTWTLPQRVEAFRETVRHITHLAHHGTADAWTRADALLLLASATALLSRRG